MNSYVSTPLATATRTGEAGYITLEAKASTVIGGYVTDAASSAVIGSYVDSDLGASAHSSRSYELAS